MTPFAGVFAALRSSRGHRSTRAFYKAVGGARGLGCTYRALLDIEAGRSLPKPPLALRLARALGVRGAAARPFAIAYLREATGSSELTGLLLGALHSAGEAAEETLFRRAAQLSFAQRSRPLSRHECDLICSDDAVYWCFTALSNDRAGLLPAELARLSGLPPARVREALARLRGAGFVQLAKDGRARCPLAGAVFTFPREKLYVPKYREKLAALWERMAGRRGAWLARLERGFEASDAGLRDCLASLAQAIYGSHIYTTREPSRDSALLVLSAVVREERR